MQRLLYVGNLASGDTNDDLEALFAAFGSVDWAQVIQNRETGRSKGFGYVEMATEFDARAAVAALHDSDHAGRRLNVNLARCSEARGGKSGNGFESASGGEEAGSR